MSTMEPNRCSLSVTTRSQVRLGGTLPGPRRSEPHPRRLPLSASPAIGATQHYYGTNTTMRDHPGSLSLASVMLVAGDSRFVALFQKRALEPSLSLVLSNCCFPSSLNISAFLSPSAAFLEP